MTPPPLPQPSPLAGGPPSGTEVVHVIRDAQHGHMPVAALRFLAGVGPAPELPELFSLKEPNQSGVRAMATYQEPPGRLMREDFAAVHIQNTVPNYGPQGVLYQTNWGLVCIHSFKAEAATFEQHIPTFLGIVRSLKQHPAWKDLAAQILQQLSAQFNAWIQQGYSQIQAAVQASHAISANNDAMLSIIDHNRQHSWSSTSTSSDHSARAFSNAMRGEETYEDPTGASPSSRTSTTTSGRTASATISRPTMPASTPTSAPP